MEFEGEYGDTGLDPALSSKALAEEREFDRLLNDERRQAIPCPENPPEAPTLEAERPQQGRPMEAPPEYADQWYARHKGYRCVLTFARTREELEILIARDELPRICPETKCDRELEPRDIEIVQVGGARQVISYAELEESWKSRPAGWPPEELEEARCTEIDPAMCPRGYCRAQGYCEREVKR